MERRGMGMERRGVEMESILMGTENIIIHPSNLPFVSVTHAKTRSQHWLLFHCLKWIYYELHSISARKTAVVSSTHLLSN